MGFEMTARLDAKLVESKGRFRPSWLTSISKGRFPVVLKYNLEILETNNVLIIKCKF